MTEIDSWSTFASNNNAAPPDGWPENTMTFGQINNTAREMMASLCRWYQDMTLGSATGPLTFSSSVGNYGYNVTLNRSTYPHTAGYTFRFRPAQPNVGPTWLNVNNTGPAWILWPDGTHLRPGDLQDFVQVRAQGDFRFMMDNLQRHERAEFAPAANVSLLFAMSAAPAGWVQNPAWNDRLIRVTGGAGTAFGGSWVITGLSAETANHTHTFSGTGTGTSAPSSESSPGFQFGGQANASLVGHSHAVTVTFSSATAGVSNAHSHTGDGNWRPAYADVILCYKP